LRPSGSSGRERSRQRRHSPEPSEEDDDASSLDLDEEQSVADPIDIGGNMGVGAGGVGRFPVPLVAETTVPLMKLYRVNDQDRTVKASMSVDMDAACTYSTDLTDCMKAICLPGSIMEIHSRSNRRSVHSNTRVTVEGEPGGFCPTFYRKSCKRIALTQNKHIELFQIHNGPLKHLVTMYILDPDNVGGKPFFNNESLACLNWALNIAKSQPLLCGAYRRLTNKRQYLYNQVVGVMVPFESVSGTKFDEKNVSDSLSRVSSDTASDFIAVFWEALGILSNANGENSEEHREVLLPLLGEVYTKSHYVSKERALNVFPAIASGFRTRAIFGTRAVGTKSSWGKKSCCTVALNDDIRIKSAMLQQANMVMEDVRKYFRKVTCPKREIFHSIDIAHEFAPLTDGNSFVCNGSSLSRYIKACASQESLEHGYEVSYLPGAGA
jgi:hypothetical protein